MIFASYWQWWSGYLSPYKGISEPCQFLQRSGCSSVSSSDMVPGHQLLLDFFLLPFGHCKPYTLEKAAFHDNLAIMPVEQKLDERRNSISVCCSNLATILVASLLPVKVTSQCLGTSSSDSSEFQKGLFPSPIWWCLWLDLVQSLCTSTELWPKPLCYLTTV